MPTYEYRCAACGHEFEKFQKISDDPVRECPKCGEQTVERLISAGGGIVFKGSGFYATDYRKEAPPKEGGSGTSGSEKKDRSDGGSEGTASSGGGESGGGGSSSGSTDPGGKDS